MKLLLWCIFSLFAYAEPLVLDKEFSYAPGSQHMQFVLDTNDSFSLESNFLWQPMHKTNFPGASYTKSLWTHLSLYNKTSVPKTIFLKNPRAGMDVIDVYVTHNAQLVKTQHLGDQRPSSLREIHNRYSLVKLTLEPFETYEVTTRLLNTIGPIEAEWDVYSQENFYIFNANEMLWWGIFGGFSLALFCYATPILLFLKDPLLSLFFGLYLISSLLNQFALNGILYFYGIQMQTINVFTTCSGTLFGFFMVLFICRFLLNNHDTSALLQRCFKIILWIQSSIILFVLLIALISPHSISDITWMIFILNILGAFLWFFLVRELIKIAKNDKVFLYIFSGYTIMIVAYVNQALVLPGIIEMSFLSKYSVSIGSLFESAFFMLGILEYMRQIQREKIQQDKLLKSQLQFASIGRVIGNISHQWKIPLVRFGGLLTQIEAALYFKKKNLETELESIIPQMHANVAFMQQTIEEFYTLYHDNNKNASFDLVKTTYNIWNMLNAKAILVNMKLHLIAPKTVEIIGSEHSFSHIMMILIDNAIEIAKTRDIPTPTLFIKIIEQEFSISITVEDTCGGLDSTMKLSSLFDVDVSSHHKTSNREVRGMGLSIAKLLIEAKFGGNIRVEHSEKGLIFHFSVLKKGI